MAGDWLKFEKSTSDKPEVWAMAEELGIDPDAVVGKLLRVWGWFDEQSEEGNAPSVSKMLLDRRVGVTGFCDSMVSCGWMQEEGSEVKLPNFDRHNGKTAKNRSLTAKRVAKHKSESNGKGNGASVTNALPREEKRREEKSKETDIVISYLNDRAGKKFRNVQGNAKHINARLKEGHTVDDMKLVIDRKVAEWKGGPMDEYLRPPTLFNSEKFEGYLNAGGSSRAPRHAGFENRDYSEGLKPDAAEGEANF